jgi:hypothetical protein
VQPASSVLADCLLSDFASMRILPRVELPCLQPAYWPSTLYPPSLSLYNTTSPLPSPLSLLSLLRDTFFPLHTPR